MENTEKKIISSVRPKDEKNWGNGGSVFIFANEKSAENDINKIRKVFSKKSWKKKED